MSTPADIAHVLLTLSVDPRLVKTLIKGLDEDKIAKVTEEISKRLRSRDDHEEHLCALVQVAAKSKVTELDATGSSSDPTTQTTGTRTRGTASQSGNTRLFGNTNKRAAAPASQVNLPKRAKTRRNIDLDQDDHDSEEYDLGSQLLAAANSEDIEGSDDNEDEIKIEPFRHDSSLRATSLPKIIHVTGAETIIPDLEVALFVPDSAGSGEWKTIDLLTATMNHAIRAKFVENFISTASKKKDYERMVNSPKSYLYGRCLSNVTGRLNISHHTYTKARGNKDRACDFCIKTQRLCVKLVGTAKNLRLGVYPLPENLRYDATWMDMEFWISD
ncbi:hypothetical protein P153DRAFT_392965 [Dothidotthia symphoricarpi CBS 119687]|uniref:Uncharacterized protein n=1 Tax=Dothidotthia symphoricarpi CBS 119687 TaxID=1392245 RepID=A0A6A6APM5_9PLEO|nr:uncharacterized protein P153DRAFT_392965 [Dothidotthia symphoricarpi CBS 119687]KAF2133108.1 hypothetical protein P153DRAFT_392965 [Dothidotthia symphoricarpi CBS 119687]